MLRRIDPNRGFKPGQWVLAIGISAAVIAAALVLSGVL